MELNGKEKSGASYSRLWFWSNEKLGCILADQLIADHPEIENHLKNNFFVKPITMIPYGADEIELTQHSIIDKHGLEPQKYSIVIARPEPENSILEIVTAFSRKERNHKLVILGNYDTKNSYHKKILNSANDEIIFMGPIYKKDTVAELRFFCKFYFHGHQVGGTNPALVEAMGAGCAVIAHDNIFNRWVLNDDAVFFKTSSDIENILETSSHKNALFEDLRAKTKKNFNIGFKWEKILKEYHDLISKE